MNNLPAEIKRLVVDYIFYKKEPYAQGIPSEAIAMAVRDLKQLTGFTLQNEFISCRSINQQRMNIGNVVLEFVSLRKQHQMGNIKTRLSWQPYLTTKL